jgi:hypothetical protein
MTIELAQEEAIFQPRNGPGISIKWPFRFTKTTAMKAYKNLAAFLAATSATIVQA